MFPWKTYRDQADDVARAIAGLTPEQLRAHPIPGVWSVQEVVCHLADSEAVFAERMKRVLAEDRPALPFADPGLYATALAYDQRDAGEEAALIGLIRRQMTRILRVQPAAAWQRVGVHSREGERTLDQLVAKAVSHQEHHLGFLLAKVAALIPPGSG